MSGFNIIDLVILLIFLSSMLVGFGRGFVSEVISLGTLIAAIIVAAIFTQPFANYLAHTATIQNIVSQTSSAVGVDTSQTASYVTLGLSFVILFAGTSLVGTIVGYILNAAFQITLMGIGNRLLGGVFGLARGFVLNLVLIFLIQLSPFSEQPLWKQSSLVAAYQPAVQWLANIVSPALANLKEKMGEKLKDATSGLSGLVR